MSGIIFIVPLLIFILWLFFSYNRIHKKFSRSVNMTLFLIDNPEDFVDHAGLLEIFRHLHREKWNRFLFGDSYIALEKIVKPGGARYYIAIPKNCEKILEGRPGLSKIQEASVPRNKFYSAAYLAHLPEKINFDNPKLNEDEGAALQILVRHLHWQEKWFDFAHHLFESLRAPQSLERPERLSNGAIFESNLEILVWADSKKRAGKILGLRSSKTAVFDFFHRIFENRERVRISFKELKDVFLN